MKAEMGNVMTYLNTDCACCVPSPWRAGLGRRGFMGLGVAAAAGLMWRPARAADGTAYDAMVLSCIDPRLVEPVHDWTVARGLKGKYSQFVFAGAAVGVVAPKFATWQPAFWDNLGTSIELHGIKKIISVNHRDCGAAKIAYGADQMDTAEKETGLHKRVAGEFRAEVKKRFAKLDIEIGLMALDGKMEMFT